MKALNCLAVALLVSVLSLSGCDSKPTHDSVTKEGIACVNEMTDIMKDVKDESSAKAAGPKLTKLKTRMDELKKKADALPKLSKEKEAELKKKHEPEMKKALEAFMKESMRVGMDPKLRPHMKDTMGG